MNELTNESMNEFTNESMNDVIDFTCTEETHARNAFHYSSTSSSNSASSSSFG